MFKLRNFNDSTTYRGVVRGMVLHPQTSNCGKQFPSIKWNDRGRKQHPKTPGELHLGRKDLLQEAVFLGKCSYCQKHDTNAGRKWKGSGKEIPQPLCSQPLISPAGEPGRGNSLWSGSQGIELGTEAWRERGEHGE